jgi:hypothetical protein
MTKQLWKTTIVIWSDYDPQNFRLQDLAFQADEGDAYCSKTEAEIIEDPVNDPDWDGTEFFDDPADDEWITVHRIDTRRAS